MKKKALTILGLGCMAMVSCTMFAGCGGESLEKEDYSKAFDSVATTMANNEHTGEVSATYPDEDFITATNDIDGLLIARISKLASEICASDNFELVSEPFSYNVSIGPLEMINIKMQFSYENKNTSFQVIMTNDLDNMAYYQYLNVNVDYDYENEKLNSFNVNSYYKMSMGTETYNYVEYNADTIKWLKLTTESYTTAKAEAVQKANNFINAKYTATEYDFTELYNSAMSLI